MKNMLRFLPLIILFALVVLFALRIESGVDPKQVQTPQIGRSMPALALPNLKTKKPEPLFARVQGKESLVNIFASWCAPCHVEHRVLLELSKTTHLQLIGIAYKDTPEAIAAYLKKMGNPYSTVLLDTDGKLGLELGLTGVPETFGVDEKGVIRTHLPGPFADEAQLQPLLNIAGAP